MGDISSPPTSPPRQSEPQIEAIAATGPLSLIEKHRPEARQQILPPQQDTFGLTRQPPVARQPSHESTTAKLGHQLDRGHAISPPSDTGPFSMAPMANALPNTGYYHLPSQPGAPQYYNQQYSQPIMQHMPHNPYSGTPTPHGPMMVPGYYVPQHPGHQYLAGNSMQNAPDHMGMQNRGNSAYYPLQYSAEHPQSHGYYQQPSQYHDPNHQGLDRGTNRQYSHGHGSQGGRNQARRGSHRPNKNAREHQKSPIDTSRQRNVTRGPPRKPQQSGHAVWIGNLPPQTDLMSLVGHVCGLAPGLQSLFLISKSNCAFANFKEEEVSNEAQKAIHDSKFQSVRLVCRLRKNNAEATSGNQIVIADGTSNPTSPTIPGNQLAELALSRNEQLASVEPRDNPTQGRGSGSNTQRDRFFVLKSLTLDDLEQSTKTGIWATQSHNEEVLNNAFKATDNVYLIFSANKSGEYFGFARMTSEINQDPEAAIQFAPQAQTTDESDLPQPVPIEATENIPKGQIIDDSERGTMFWEIHEQEGQGGSGDESESSAKDSDDGDEDLQTWGKPFHLRWLSTIRLPFYRTRGIRNPWNSNREVKIARDGTELETSIGRRLVGLMSNNSNAAPGARPMNAARGGPAFF